MVVGAALAAMAAAPAMAAGCPAPGSVRSANSQQKAVLELQNKTRGKVSIYWLDYKGDRRFYTAINAGRSYKQQTYATHPWVAVDDRGNCVGGVFRANPGLNTFQIM